MTTSPRHIYFEDLPVGLAVEGGRYVLTEAEIIEFGTRFDPLPIHVDPVAAKNSPFGGLIAAGCHLIAISINLNHQLHGDDIYHYVAGLGYTDVRFQKPAMAGDVLTLRREITQSHRSRSKPHVGVVHLASTLLNERGEVVAVLAGAAMIECRPE